MNLNERLFKTTCPRLISVVGGGGKTSVLRTLADEYLKQGKRVIVTTTTKMKHPEPRELLASTVADVKSKLAENRFCVLGKVFDERKIGRVDGAVFDAALNLADVMINEADGAKMLPLKAPISSEPVLPLKTDFVIVVAGLDAVYRPIKETCFRPDEVLKLLNMTDDSKEITPRDIAKIITRGYLEKTPFPAAVLLNKADNGDRFRLGQKIASFLPDINVLIAALHDGPKVF